MSDLDLSSNDSPRSSTNSASSDTDSSLHAAMLSFVYEKQLADRLQHSPIQVWEEFVDEFRESEIISPLLKTPPVLMEIFVRDVLPNFCVKTEQEVGHTTAAYRYLCFLNLCLQNLHRNHEKSTKIPVHRSTKFKVYGRLLCIDFQFAIYFQFNIFVLHAVKCFNCKIYTGKFIKIKICN